MARKIILPEPVGRFSAPATGYAVRYETFLVDPKTGVETPLQRGHNMITDAGMDQMAIQNPTGGFLDTIHCLSDTLILKRLPDPANALTATFTDATSIALAASAGFFEAQDVGRTLKINGWPELLITAFTDTLNITAKGRAGLWLPGFTVPASPDGPHTNDWGVHYTNFGTTTAPVVTLTSAQFDTGDPDYDTIGTNVSSRRFEHKRAWISGAISGGATIRALAWRNSAPDVAAPYGVIALTNPDTVPAGKKYKVKLTFHQTFTQLVISGAALDLGPIIGTTSLDAKTVKYMPYGGWLVPHSTASRTRIRTTGTYDLTVAEQWHGDAGWTNESLQSSAGSDAIGGYTAGEFTRTRTLSYNGSADLTIAGISQQFYETAIAMTDFQGNFTPTITKAVDVFFDMTFRIHWTRELVN